MRITETCANCLYNKELRRSQNEEYLAEIREILDRRKEDDCSPYMVFLFNKVYERYFGRIPCYKDIKKQYNDLVLDMEAALRSEIERAEDPLAKALVIARIGNYIDFGALEHVDQEEFMGLFKNAEMHDAEFLVYESFLKECAAGKSFLLVCDNCGEIVLDRLMIEQLKKRFPQLSVKALVRGGEALNDATVEDAEYVGLDKMAEIVSNGTPITGTIYDMMPHEARSVIDDADVILAKGQGNYESMSGYGRHIFYEFLCKCDLFTDRYNVPKFTGMFVEETGKIETNV